jgi:archaellum component FlaC
VQNFEYVAEQLETLQRQQEQESSLYAGTQVGDLRQQVRSLARTIKEEGARADASEQKLNAVVIENTSLLQEKAVLECGPLN